MKFAIFVVVVFALASAAQSSAIPWLAVSGHGGAIAAPGSVAVQASVSHGPVAAAAIQSIPHIVAHQSAVAVAPHAVASGAEGTYVAKTLGAVHVAPLPGHVQSAVSHNLQPAPGTA